MIYAHQGGWDEILMVLVPVALIVALLALAKHRAERAGDRQADGDGATPENPAPPSI